MPGENFRGWRPFWSQGLSLAIRCNAGVNDRSVTFRMQLRGDIQ
ncbi:hypothetical protein [Kovacikia minuta]|nr:hypothetical protein [Kovacikia minuta]